MDRRRPGSAGSNVGFEDRQAQLRAKLLSPLTGHCSDHVVLSFEGDCGARGAAQHGDGTADEGGHIRACARANGPAGLRGRTRSARQRKSSVLEEAPQARV